MAGLCQQGGDRERKRQWRRSGCWRPSVRSVQGVVAHTALLSAMKGKGEPSEARWGGEERKRELL